MKALLILAGITAFLFVVGASPLSEMALAVTLAWAAWKLAVAAVEGVLALAAAGADGAPRVVARFLNRVEAERESQRRRGGG